LESETKLHQTRYFYQNWEKSIRHHRIGQKQLSDFQKINAGNTELNWPPGHTLRPFHNSFN